MAIRCLLNKYTNIVLLSLIFSIQVVCCPALLAGDLRLIRPGMGISPDFNLGENVHNAIIRYETIYNRPSGAFRDGAMIYLKNIGIKLVHQNDRIVQIIIYNTQLSTDRYVRVYSPVETVYSAYGRPTITSSIPGGYYVRYDGMGIGFDIDSQTHLIRAIVIYPPSY